MFPVFLGLLLLLLLTGPGLLFANGQNAQTSAVCTKEYEWMANEKGDSPCQVASQVNSLCNSGTWNVPAINASINYNPPWISDGTASLCTCSWTSYNLISGCQACQGYPEKNPFWSYYITNCTDKLSTTYFPPSISIPSYIKFPYWAGKDPTTWRNQKFDPAEAKQIYQTSQPNLPLSSTPSLPPDKPVPIGAIAGGVLGGVVAVACFVAFLIWLLRRYRPAAPGIPPDDKPAHMRKFSDLTVTSATTGLVGDSTLASTSSGGVRRNTSISSLPFFNSILGRDARMSLAAQAPLQAESPRPEDIITPFTLPQTHETPEKKSDGDWPIFDSPNAPPQSAAVRMSVIPSSTPLRRGATRYNPPAYSESDPTSPSLSRHHPQDSMDSISTPAESSIGQFGSLRRPTHTPGNSGSSLGHMAVSTPMRTSTGTIYTSISTNRTSAGPGTGPTTTSLGHSRSLFGGRSTSIRRQTEDSFTPSDIA